MIWGGEDAPASPNPENALCCCWGCVGDVPNIFTGDTGVAVGCAAPRFPKMETRSSSGFDEIPATRFAAAGTVVEICVAASPDG